MTFHVISMLSDTPFSRNESIQMIEGCVKSQKIRNPIKDNSITVHI